MSEIEEGKSGGGGDEEGDVEPAVVEVELQVAQHRGDDRSVLGGHVHSH